MKSDWDGPTKHVHCPYWRGRVRHHHLTMATAQKNVTLRWCTVEGDRINPTNRGNPMPQGFLAAAARDHETPESAEAAG